MIKRFDRPAVRAILDECEAALKAVADRHGLRLTRKGCSFRADECPVPFRLLTVATDEDGEVVTPEMRDFERCAVLYGLKPEDLGREFSSRGRRFEICGAKPANRRYPVLAKCVETGKVYKFPESVVRVALGGSTTTSAVA